jgi:hypothetical protein
MGEVCVLQWLQNNHVKAQKGEAIDIVSTKNIQVKTWRRETWDQYGRAVAMRHLDKYLKQDCTIVWCIAESNCRIRIVGFNHVRHFLTNAKDIEVNGVKSRQLGIDIVNTKINDLLEVLK